MPRKARFWIVFAILIQVLWSLPLGGYFAYRWLAFDDPDNSFTCQDSRGRVSTCVEGETTNMIVGIVFLTIGLIMLGVALWLAVRWIKRGRREDHLRQHGIPARAVVTQAMATGTRVNGRPLYRLTLQVPDVPGLEFRHRTMNPVPAGTTLTVAYDPADPADPVLLDDLAAIAPSLRYTPTAVDARIQRLTQLDSLRASGAISEEEFERLKAEALNQN
ncbi:hypothetical protein Aple_052040 [Acrocarpospora pleiomorpha]|uniref:SHOCT domain-containing protein n=1 Tax=Acrocarpospora pleiomorpha TaxID=90975 RepID=A0A5M3XLL8_9ACTN|nr:DUF3592 domain-containing protein [Acrocarpospora pleiomorpha]GES22307.1 hypothetical protein Aple_052040 [Acrocarpospora pleiomorpha]